MPSPCREWPLMLYHLMILLRLSYFRHLSVKTFIYHVGTLSKYCTTSSSIAYMSGTVIGIGKTYLRHRHCQCLMESDMKMFY